MSLVDVKDVRINFPFQPYPCQVTYMERVLQCLQQEENGVLESPTGTGKTLCLLCSSLAWLESRKAQVELSRQAGVAAIMAESGKENMEQSTLAAVAESLKRASGSASWGSNEFVVPKIIYASRTHSQLSQAVQELKRTAYNSMKTAVIGSREQLCINEHVKKEKNNSTKVHLCRAKVSARQCHYYNVLEDLKRNTEARQVVGNVTDIEDLVSHGSKSKVCPYYLARELKSDADIIFMPYNYLLDPKSRRAHGIELQGNIIIFDEAHNLEQICEESASFELSSVDLATAIEETTQLGVKLTELVSSEAGFSDMGDEAVVPEFTLEDIIKLKKTLLELEELIDSEPLVNRAAVKPGMFMFELMAKVNITFSSKFLVIDLMDKMISHLNTSGTSSVLHSKGAGLSKVADALKIIFNQEPGESVPISQHRESLAQHYKVHIQEKDTNSHRKKKLESWSSAGTQDKSERVLSYWCFSPGYSMQELKAQGVKSIILTSGTLSPIDSFTAEMQIPFRVRLENPHVIQKHQVWVGTLKCGPDGTILNSNFQNRFTDAYQTSLGNTIVNFARVVPDGVLVFFPSYPVMESCVEKWQNTNVWDRIMANKPVVLEPRGKDAFTQAIEDFYAKINDSQHSGAVFMAVCRGKVSEGLDFADMNGRAVILTGLPYPPMKDPRVILKMQHLDSHRGKQGFKGLTGQQWYKQQATRAVNQAIGRVIRHKDDFGAILLCDSRFASPDSINGLPMWVKPHVTKYDSFGPAVRDTLKFFKVAEKMLPAPVRRGSRRDREGGSGQGGGGAAYFEPTVSRRGTSVEQASSVPCHVPGFGKHTEDSVDSLKKQYSGTSNESVRKRGLLQALDSIEGCSGTSPCVSQLEPSSSEGSVKIHSNSKRRKIIIKPSSGKTSAASKPEAGKTEQGASSKPPSRTTPAQQKVAENYLAEVKAALNQSDYKRFSSTLHEYKKSGKLSTASTLMAELFTSCSEHFPLFRGFYRFVRPQHKAEYDQLCVSLTGQSHSYQPEHALSGKQLLPANKPVEPKDKVTKLASASSSSVGLGQWSASLPSTSSHTPHASHTSHAPQSSQAPQSSRHTSQTAVETDKHTHACHMPSQNKLTDSNCDASSSQDTVTSKKGTSDDLAAITSSTTESVRHKRDDTDPEDPGFSAQLDVDKIHNMSNQANTVFPSTGYKCCKCNKDAHVPFVSRQCEHVCCLRCWRSVLKGDKLCPGGCGQTVIRRNLQQLMFASGDEVVL